MPTKERQMINENNNNGHNTKTYLGVISLFNSQKIPSPLTYKLGAAKDVVPCS